MLRRVSDTIISSKTVRINKILHKEWIFMSREEKETEIRRLAEDMSHLSDILVDIVYALLRNE